MADIKVCSMCKNRKMELKRGIVCGLTDEKPQWTEKCESFVLDESELRTEMINEGVEFEDPKYFPERRRRRKTWSIVISLIVLVFCASTWIMRVQKAGRIMDRMSYRQGQSMELMQGLVKYVDLGLPSGAKWATCNIGANNPEDSGIFHTAGDLELPDGWRLPTAQEVEELMTECTWSWGLLHDVYGCEVTGPNGISIFLPVTGFKQGDILADIDSHGFYLVDGEDDDDDDQIITALMFCSDYMRVIQCEGEAALAVRPVLDKE